MKQGAGRDGDHPAATAAITASRCALERVALVAAPDSLGRVMRCNQPGCPTRAGSAGVGP